MALEIFWAPGSAPARRVLLTLAVKGAPYESRPLRLGRGEQRAPAYLAVNPRGKVPALRDGALTLTESLAIMVYLDRRFPAPPLFGETAEEAGAIHRSIAEHESYFWGPLLALVRPLMYGAPGAAAALAPEIGAAAAALRAEVEGLERALATGEYLETGRLSAADLVWFPSVELVMRAAGRRPELGLVAEAFPAVARWGARIEALAAVTGMRRKEDPL